MTRYRDAFTWTRTIDDFIRWEIRETPILNACAGRSAWGDVTLDLHEPADVQGCWTSLPFERDSFGAVFADPPWDSGHKTEVAAFVREALRVAPVAYLMAPWLYCASWAPITRVWWRELPGVNSPVLLSRYERTRQLSLLDDEWCARPPTAILAP
jgi:hypothetical protein